MRVVHVAVASLPARPVGEGQPDIPLLDVVEDFHELAVVAFLPERGEAFGDERAAAAATRWRALDRRGSGTWLGRVVGGRPRRDDRR